MLRKLPLGIQTFHKLRKDNCVYVDKTEHAYNLITRGYRYFLSRPRRFGKSLFVSTLHEILSGNKSLFDDLWIAQSDYQWKSHGVIKLDFSSVAGTDVERFEAGLQRVLIEIAEAYDLDINLKPDAPELMLRTLIKALYKRFGYVAVLIDEYDSPILRILHDHEHARKIRSAIQQFFSAIKSLDAEISFVFITGVTSFAKAGLFSGINNLTIITLDKQYATICGYTDQEIDHNFGDFITVWSQKENVSYDQIREQMQTWYNGYHFGENVVPVYNPFSVMHALNIQTFENFWFQSGAPTFLVEILKKEYKDFDPENLTMTKDALGIFDVGATPLLALMFQAGYLTIAGYDSESQEFTLDYPNAEVKRSLQKYLLEVFVHLNPIVAERKALDLRAALMKGDIEGAVFSIKQLFAHVPYQLHIPEEKFYHALFQMACTAAGIKAQSEYSTSHGRIDLILDFPKFLYVVEVKFNKPAQEALEQIETRRYYERFLNQDKPVILLGLSFERAPSHFDVGYVEKRLN